ncbi:MAG: rod shape-determining protein MreC [Elusimicrobia bacterium]|nr:rod shape-determining protein MreC [Elusimicrobiota bacterium]
MKPHREDRTVNIILASLCSVSLLMMLLPLSRPIRAVRAFVGHVFEPMMFAGAEGTERLALVPSRARQLIVADIENRSLKDEFARVGLLRAELESLRAENARLSASLGLQLPEGRGAVWARVMERDPLTWYQSVAVDVGRAQGVGLNAAVLAQDEGQLVVIGRIAEVGERTSKVLLVTDEFSSVAAYLSSGTVEGLIQGQGSERLRMNYLHSEAVVVTGDEVRTSATSATFPPGILIGTVAKPYARDPFLTFQSVEIRPAVDPASVKEVMILK